MSHEDSCNHDDAVLDRRAFLSRGIAVGAVLASGAALGFTAPPVSPAAAGNGHVDDACGHCPPYSHPIPYGYASPAQSPWEHWDPIDLNYVS